MQQTARGLASSILLIVHSSTSKALASGQPTPQGKTAIQPASFGTIPQSAVKTIANISDQAQIAYPKIEPGITFTCEMIKSVLKKKIERRGTRNITFWY